MMVEMPQTHSSGPPSLSLPAPVQTHTGSEDEVIPSQSLHNFASEWRWPELDSKLPLYVQRDFLVKLYGLCALQLVLCFSIALFLHPFVKREVQNAASVHDGEDSSEAENSSLAKVLPLPTHGSIVLLVAYYALAVIIMLLLLVLWRVRSRHPRNYSCLAVLTLFMGSFWGVSSGSFAHDQQLYLLAQLALTLGTASLICRLALRKGARCESSAVALVAVGLGWLVGALAVVVYARVLGPQHSVQPSLAACALSIVALLFVFFYTWRSLSSSSTDGLIGLIGVVDACALAAVSLPYLFILLACCAQSALPSMQSPGNGEVEESSEASAHDDPEQGRTEG